MQSVLRKRIAPAIPLTLELREETGKRIINLKLSWTFRTSAEVEEKTGVNCLTPEVWSKLSSKNLGIMLWAALLEHQPEYGERLADESFAEFEAIRKERQADGIDAVLSYIDLGNCDKISDAVWKAYFDSLDDEKKKALEEAKRALIEGTKKEVRPLVLEPNPSAGSMPGPSPDTTSDLVTTNSST